LVSFEYEEAVDSRIVIGVFGSPYQVSQSTATHFELVGTFWIKQPNLI
jgi:hypothetical protein